MSAEYIPDLYRFLDELSRNNNREWFQANKERYDVLRELWLADLDRMIAAMGEWEPALRHVTARDCAYRIYRDTRFSLDKTPYKTYFSALISPTGRKCDRACFYLHMGQDESGLYGGIWHPTSPQLRKLRQAIVDNIEEFEEIVSDPEMLRYFPGWWGERLKTIPKGWDRDHPQAELLRLKEYGRLCDVNRRFFATGSWPEKAADRLRLLKPLNDFLNYSLDE